MKRVSAERANDSTNSIPGVNVHFVPTKHIFCKLDTTKHTFCYNELSNM